MDVSNTSSLSTAAASSNSAVNVAAAPLQKALEVSQNSLLALISGVQQKEGTGNLVDFKA